MKFKKDRLCLYIGLLTVELYWLRFIKTNVELGIMADSIVLYKGSNRWSKDLCIWSFVIKVLGFGAGIAWKHCENPNKQS